ncbi:MAG TPA: hypothetical protein VNJ04_11960 [Gemmatimonadaceae bacterium]|nr:hypothetical protein [Gemmatimonadaceae bacterium]
MTICDKCHRRCRQAELVTVAVEVCRQTHSSPAEYDEVRLCADCAADDGSYAEEMRALRGLSTEERERI